MGSFVKGGWDKSIVFKQGTESTVICHKTDSRLFMQSSDYRGGGEVISKVLVEVEVSFK